MGVDIPPLRFIDTHWNWSSCREIFLYANCR